MKKFFVKWRRCFLLRIQIAYVRRRMRRTTDNTEYYILSDHLFDLRDQLYMEMR